MVFLARNPDPPEAPAVLPCRLPPCSRPVPLRSALRRTAPASHSAPSRPCSRLSLSPRPAVLPRFAPSRICCHLPVPASSPLPRLPCQAFARPHLAARPAPPILPHPPSHPAPHRPAVPFPAAFRTLLTTLRRAAALPALHRRAAVRISPGGPRWLLFLRLARGSRMPAQGAFASQSRQKCAEAPCGRGGRGSRGGCGG